MKKIKCTCGWTGSKYEVLVNMFGYTCPKCDAVIPDDSVLTDKDKKELQADLAKVSISTPLK